MNSNIALSYIAMLSVVAFFLWVIRNFVRGLRKRSQIVPVVPALHATDQPAESDKKAVYWPAHIFLGKEDDIPIPGVLISISPTDAFMESSACLTTEQEITLYVEVPGQEQVRLTAKVIWARESRDGRNAAQLGFSSSCAGVMKTLYRLA